MKIVFMGTPAFSVPALQGLHEHHEIVAVYTQPPRPAGRGRQVLPGPVQAAAEALGLPVRHPASLRDGRAQAEFAALRADVAVVAAYGLILPQAVLDMPAQGCLNIHASLLPRWRGAAPIHRAVMAGDAQTGVCIMTMEASLDTGPVLLRQATPIGAEETTGDLHDRLAEMGAALVRRALDERPEAAVQPEDGVSYAAKIDKAEARVDWTRPAIEVDRLIRGLSPAPGAWCDMAGERVKLLRCRMGQGDGAPGQVLGLVGGALIVACGTGAVEIMVLQRTGRRSMPVIEALRGLTMPARFN